MPQLYSMTPRLRSEAVADACARVIRRTTEGLAPQAVVIFRNGYGEPEAITRELVGTGWNPTTTGTQEALIVRSLSSYWTLDMIPYTRLISVEPA